MKVLFTRSQARFLVNTKIYFTEILFLEIVTTNPSLTLTAIKLSESGSHAPAWNPRQDAPRLGTRSVSNWHSTRSVERVISLT